MLDRKQEDIIKRIKERKAEEDYKEVVPPGYVKLPNGKITVPIRVLDKKEYNAILQAEKDEQRARQAQAFKQK